LYRHAKPLDALYCHTQELAGMLVGYMKRVPTVLSLDATPTNLDSFGHEYGHRGLAARKVKDFLVKRSLHQAAHVVAISRWVKDSLINDYGLSEHKITVNTWGVDLALWNISQEERADSQKDPSPRVLFVGGDFRRKGGEALVEYAASMQGQLAVDIVTNDTVPLAEEIANLRTHRGLKPGTQELLTLYRNAGIFVLPTLADISPWVFMEAMAMRLPVVATRIGAIPEIVADGETGLLIPPNSPEALGKAIEELAKNPELRRRMGNAGRKRVEQYFDGRVSYDKLIALIKAVAHGRSATAG
jgi:glycosyltransferase involved in cell wall biosynthesis